MINRMLELVRDIGQEEVIPEDMKVAYADDCAVMALSELELPEIVSVFSDAYAIFGLSVNCKKTQVLYQDPPNGTASVPSISVWKAARGGRQLSIP